MQRLISHSAPLQVMSLKSADEPHRSKIFFKDEDGYIVWGSNIVVFFLDAKLVSEIDKDLPYFPANSSNHRAWEQEYWKRTIEDYVNKKLKADDIKRPLRNIQKTFEETEAGIKAKADSTLSDKAYKALEKTYINQKSAETQESKHDLDNFEKTREDIRLNAESFLKGEARSEN